MTIEGGRNLHYKFCSLFLPSTKGIFTYIPTNLWVFFLKRSFQFICLRKTRGPSVLHVGLYIRGSSWLSPTRFFSSCLHLCWTTCIVIFSSSTPKCSRIWEQKRFQDPIHLSLDVPCSINLTLHPGRGGINIIHHNLMSWLEKSARMAKQAVVPQRELKKPW